MDVIKNSRAKLNLFLEITGKDNKGYHLLESYFALLKLADKVILKSFDQLKCEVKGENIEGENIVIKAIKELSDYVKSPINAYCEINKKIPIAAGLGGGSSNAAIVLKVLNEELKLNLTEDELITIALKIGMDVVFFIKDKNAFVKGIGDIVLPMKLDIKLPLLLVNPKIKISSKDVYKVSVKTFNQSLGDEVNKEQIIDKIYNGINALEVPASFLFPEINAILNIIKKQPGCIVSRMSGSGSTCFGIFKSEELAFASLNSLQKIYPDFWFYYELLEL